MIEEWSARGWRQASIKGLNVCIADKHCHALVFIASSLRGCFLKSIH